MRNARGGRADSGPYSVPFFFVFFLFFYIKYAYLFGMMRPWSGDLYPEERSKGRPESEKEYRKKIQKEQTGTNNIGN